MKNNQIYQAPVLKEIGITVSFCISTSSYGAPGQAGNYDSGSDNDYTDIDF